ncbi:MAG: DNA polymerase III subunit delta [Rhodocyclaceae bacterium]|nr:DNA polymerase III subunit delta [Rhodocyclaceae bacterium]
MAVLRPEQLSSHLSGPLAPLYVLHGNAPLLVEEAADAIRAAARSQGVTEREILVTGQGFRWEQLAMASGNLSLFGDRKLLDLRIPNGKPGKDGGEALERLCASLELGGDCVLITLPELDWAARKANWFGTLSDRAVVLELLTPPREQLPAWIAVRLKRQGQSAPAEALEFMAEHVEGNLLAAHQEISKLGLLYEPGELDLPRVREAVLNVARYDVEALRLAMLDGDPGRCARLLEGLRGEGEAPPLILWTLAADLRALARARAAIDQGGSAASALKAERVFEPRRRQAIERVVRRLRPRQIRNALQHAARIDRIIKGLQPGDLWDEFLQLMLRLRPRG